MANRKPRTDFPDLTGRRFGRLLAGARITHGRLGATSYECNCDCGEKIVVHAHRLWNGNTKSCGCLSRDRAREGAIQRNTRHGMARTPEYRAWKGMIERCCNATCKDYPRWGGRGIAVCERWRNSFENFLADIGPRPSTEHSLDRKDVNGDYCPENCRWALNLTQQNNRRDNLFLTFDGRTQSASDWARAYGLRPGCVHARLKRGWPIERTLTTPVQGGVR